MAKQCRCGLIIGEVTPEMRVHDANPLMGEDLG
jgi:hypothetical protein